MHKFKLFVFVVLAATLLAGCNNINPNPRPNPGDSDALTDKGFTATVVYQENNQWNYTVKGDVPTPCHTVEVDALVMESYPEQVSLNVTVTAPSDDTMCAQVIDTKEVIGSFQASEQAKVTLKVVN